MENINLYICLHDGHWLFYEPIIQKFLDGLDAPPSHRHLPYCPACKKEMHCVTGLERLQLIEREEEAS